MCVKDTFRKDVFIEWTKTTYINTPTTKLKKNKYNNLLKPKNIQKPTGKILCEISTLI